MKKYLILTLALPFIACASAADYGSCMRTSAKDFDIVSSGDTEKEARNNGLKAAQLSCKEAGYGTSYIVNKQEVIYKGMLGSGDNQKIISGALGVAGAILKGKDTTATKKINKNLTDDSFEYRLTITCQ